jgi:uncharacterized protein (TIGR00730 family)
MAEIKSICVYCGSRNGVDPRHVEAARSLGTQIAQAGIELVYGGGRIGLMGVVADAVLAGGGRVCGIIPHHLQSVEVGHQGLTELHVVDSMHVRKQMMFERSDAFVVLPGGIGTLDETFEMITWRQLRLHDRPVVVVDLAGYWQPYIQMIDHIIGQGFAGPEIRRLYDVVDSAEAVLPLLARLPEPAISAKPERL